MFRGAFRLKKNGFILALAVAVFFVFTILFYGPLALYLENAEELWFSLRTTLKIIVPVSLAVLALFILVVWALPESVSRLLVRLAFGVTLAMYVQGTLINTNYGGVLNGQEIEWAKYTGYGIWTLLVWMVCIALPFLLPKIRSLKSEKIILAAALFLTAVQVPALIVERINYIPGTQGNLLVSKDGEFEYGRKENIIIIAMDTMDEAYFQEYISAHPESEETLEGFIHYDNTLASGAATIIGVPSLLTGEPYKQGSTYTEYVTNIWSKHNPLSALYKKGYDVRVFTENIFYSADTAKYVDNIEITGENVGSYKILAKKLYKLTAFKFSQHFIKPRFWFDTAEFSAAQATGNKYSPNDATFYKNYLSSGITVSDNKDKAFRFYLLNGAHSPYKLTRDATSSSEKTSRQEQVEGVFKIVTEILEDMKEKGIYDSATIILTADHGERHEGEYLTFLYKAPFADHPYKTSHVPVSMFDLPVLLYQLAGEDENGEYGTDFTKLSEDEVRLRHFFRNQRGTSKINIEEYETIADAGDADSLRLVTVHESQNGKQPVARGTTLLFNQDATGNVYAEEGFGNNTGYRSILYGPYANLSIPLADLPAEGEIAVSITLANVSKTGYPYSIYANALEMCSGTVDKDMLKNGISFTVPVESFDENRILNIEFVFPSVSKDELDIKKVNSRTQTLSLVDMTIS